MNVDLPDNVRVLDCIYTTEKVMWKKQQEMWSYNLISCHCKFFNTITHLISHFPIYDFTIKNFIPQTLFNSRFIWLCYNVMRLMSILWVGIPTCGPHHDSSVWEDVV